MHGLSTQAFQKPGSIVGMFDLLIFGANYFQKMSHFNVCENTFHVKNVQVHRSKCEHNSAVTLWSDT